MSNILVKEVEFFGTELLAVQEVESGKIYAGINAILKGMGFDDKQIEYRREKWVTDKTISKGTLKFSGTLIGAKTGKDVWCIDIKKLPLALAKLEITPKLEKELPELSQKLEVYQDACADVLSDAFLPQRTTITYQYPLPASTFESVANLGRLIERVMKSEGACPHEVATVLKTVFQQSGLEIQDCFVKVPAYEQLSMFNPNEIITRH